MTLIAEKGPAAVSMRVVADLVGLTAGAIYRYFPSRQDLLLYCWSEAITGLTDRFEAVAAAELEPLQAIRSILAAYGEFGLEDIDRFKVVFMPEDLDTAAPQVMPRAQALARSQIERAVSAGLFGTISVDTAMQILWASIHGILVLQDATDTEDLSDIQTLIDTAIDVVIAGLIQRGAAK